MSKSIYAPMIKKLVNAPRFKLFELPLPEGADPEKALVRVSAEANVRWGRGSATFKRNGTAIYGCKVF